MGFLDARFLAYLAVATLLIVTPGPDTALVTRNTLLAGRRASAFTILGIGAGSIVWALASVGGVAVLLERSALAFTVFKFAGAAYLVYLGLRGLFNSRSSASYIASASADALHSLHDSPHGAARLSAPASFRQGLLSNLLNPKAGAIFATALPQFIVPGDSSVRLIVMLLAYEVILFAWLNIYAALIHRAGRSRVGGQVRAWLGRATGAVLIALGIRLAFEQR
jgi:threonine/homoserine/homoserine lactone efflux protein